METLKIVKVPVLAAEDETAIVGKVEDNQERDEMLCFCGVEGPYYFSCLTL